MKIIQWLTNGIGLSVDRDKPAPLPNIRIPFAIWVMGILDFGLWTWAFFYGLGGEVGMTQGYHHDHSLSLRLIKCFLDNVLLEHGGWWTWTAACQ